MPNLYTLTGDFDDLLGGDGLVIRKAYIETNIAPDKAIVNTTGKKIRLGWQSLSFTAGNVFTADNLVGSNSTDLNIPVDTLQYQVVVEYAPGSAGPRETRMWRSGWFFLNAASNLADLAVTDAPTPVTGTLDADVANLVNPTSQTGQKLSATYAPITRPNTIALLGDSITNQNSAADSTTIFYYSAQGYFTWANALDGQRWTIVTPDGSNIGEFGGSGLTTAQLISGGHSASAAASSAAYVLVHGGTNDLATRTAAEIAADLLTIWRAQTAEGKRVIAATILPRDDAADTEATRTKIRDANRLIRANATAETGVTLCDWYAALVDPSTGKVNLDYLYDGVHPDSIGAARMGKVLAAVLSQVGPHDWNTRLPWDAVDAKSLLPNPFQIGATAGVATSAAVYTLGAGVYTASKVARTDGIAGEWQQLAITSAPSPNDDGAQYQQQNTAVDVDWAAGETAHAVCEFETDAAAWAMRHVNFSVAFYNGIGNAGATRLSSAQRTAITAPLPLLPRGILRTPSFVIPAGTTRLQADVHCYGAGTIRLGRFDIIKA